MVFESNMKAGFCIEEKNPGYGGEQLRYWVEIAVCVYPSHWNQFDLWKYAVGTY